MSITLRRLHAAAVAIMLSRLVPASAQQRTPAPAPSFALPGCLDRCGNITVPYPFGIGAGCYRDDGHHSFELLCDNSSSPPRLSVTLFDDYSLAKYGKMKFNNYQLTSISLDAGEAWTNLQATRMCYDKGTGQYVNGSRTTMSMSLVNSSYLLSANKNRLVALGCGNLGYFTNYMGRYASGCMSSCWQSHSTDQMQCTGEGCCQIEIPPGINVFVPHQQHNFSWTKWEKPEPAISDFGVPVCYYVVLVEAEWFRDHSHQYINSTGDFTMPVVLDWAVRNVGNCSEARGNKADYACRSDNSRCVESTNGPGYRCICSNGYQGNPYIDKGCRDIDECNNSEYPPCYGVCTNTPGSYICECPWGTKGNASVPNSCQSKDTFTLALKVVTGVSVAVFLSVFMCFWLYLGLQKRKLIKAKQRFFEENGGVLLQQQMRSYAGAGAGGFKLFSEEKLKKATDNFAAARVLGRGGYGIVYRGVLEDKSTVVAIKKSKVMEAAQTKEFAKEMFILSQINHRNIVKLLGCCLEVEVPMLVYEFVSNGTLYHYIHSNKSPDAEITFDTRLRIAAESAEALAYMHSSASPPIIHGDVKTANILLDNKLTAKVSDFGASKLAPTDEVEIATLVQGTCGYMDPEYLMTWQLTDKSDVYSFGVVLLELLTRKKALYIDGPEESRSLVACFTMAAKDGRHGELLDSQVRNEMRVEVLDEVAHLILQCVSMTGDERPTMKAVAERLEMLRRYQQHPWGQADDEDLERQGLLGTEQQDNISYCYQSN